MHKLSINVDDVRNSSLKQLYLTKLFVKSGQSIALVKTPESKPRTRKDKTSIGRLTDISPNGFYSQKEACLELSSLLP